MCPHAGSFTGGTAVHPTNLHTVLNYEWGAFAQPLAKRGTGGRSCFRRRYTRLGDLPLHLVAPRQQDVDHGNLPVRILNVSMLAELTKDEVERLTPASCTVRALPG